LQAALPACLLQAKIAKLRETIETQNRKPMLTISDSLPLVPLLYVALAGAYLLVLPLLTMLYLKQRWYTAGSIERLLLYFLVFFLFPGLLLISPFLNFRPEKRQLET
jgi:NAD(P)H-quinone oxidoreductase subunit L